MGGISAGLGATSSAATPTEVAVAYFDAYSRRDLDAMEARYAPGVHFQDPVFEHDGRAATMGMWRALLPRSHGMQTRWRITGADGDRVHVHWDARYSFLGRPVRTSADTTLTVRGGEIVDERGAWDYGRWARQALPLGPALASSDAVRAALTGALRLLNASETS